MPETTPEEEEETTTNAVVIAGQKETTAAAPTGRGGGDAFVAETDSDEAAIITTTASPSSSSRRSYQRKGTTAVVTVPGDVFTNTARTQETTPSSGGENDDDDDIEKLVYTSEETNNETVRIILSTLAGLPPSPPTTAAVPEEDATSAAAGDEQPGMFAPHAAPPAAITKCPPRRVRTVSWPWTAAGTTAEVACPVGTRGTARWRCSLSSGGGGGGRNAKETAAIAAVWEPAAAPDLSECQSTWMGRILADLRKSDAVGTIAADLVQYVTANPLYGGDVAAAVSAMTIVGEKLEYQLAAIPTMEQREVMVVEVAQSLVRTASGLLDVDSLAAWRDLPPRVRGRTLAAFLAALERAGHLLPRAIPADREVSISSQNVCKYIFYSIFYCHRRSRRRMY
jgi:hypothetical protein